MTALSKNRVVPLLVAIAAVLSIGAVVGLRPFLKFLQRWKELQKRRKARLALLDKMPDSTKVRKIQQVSLFALPDLKEGSDPRKKLEAICEQMNTVFPCIKASFNIYGTKKMPKEELLKLLQKPDMSFYMTHCFHYVADDEVAQKLLLHSNLHKQDWFSTGGPFYRGCIEVATDLTIDLKTQGEDPILQIVFLRFQPHVTDDSEVYASFQQCVGEFSSLPGVSAALNPYGHGKLIKEDFIREIQWNDSSMGMTHCLAVTAGSPVELKALQDSAIYKKWLTIEMPHLDQGQFPPPAVIFYAPLQVESTC